MLLSNKTTWYLLFYKIQDQFIQTRFLKKMMLIVLKSVFWKGLFADFKKIRYYVCKASKGLPMTKKVESHNFIIEKWIYFFQSNHWVPHWFQRSWISSDFINIWVFFFYMYSGTSCCILMSFYFKRRGIDAIFYD